MMCLLRTSLVSGSRGSLLSAAYPFKQYVNFACLYHGAKINSILSFGGVGLIKKAGDICFPLNVHFSYKAV